MLSDAKTEIEKKCYDARKQVMILVISHATPSRIISQNYTSNESKQNMQ